MSDWIDLVSTGCLSMLRLRSIKHILLMPYFYVFFFLGSMRKERSKLVASSVSESAPICH